MKLLPILAMLPLVAWLAVLWVVVDEAIDEAINPHECSESGCGGYLCIPK